MDHQQNRKDDGGSCGAVANDPSPLEHELLSNAVLAEEQHEVDDEVDRVNDEYDVVPSLLWPVGDVEDQQQDLKIRWEHREKYVSSSAVVYLV